MPCAIRYSSQSKSFQSFFKGIVCVECNLQCRYYSEALAYTSQRITERVSKVTEFPQGNSICWRILSFRDFVLLEENGGIYTELVESKILFNSSRNPSRCVRDRFQSYGIYLMMWSVSLLKFGRDLNNSRFVPHYANFGSSSIHRRSTQCCICCLVAVTEFTISQNGTSKGRFQNLHRILTDFGVNYRPAGIDKDTYLQERRGVSANGLKK